MSGIWGALIEAWEELRVHKLRVLLSLIGVAVAVLAMTSVTAIGQMMNRVMEQMNALGGGRVATVYVYAWDETSDGEPSDTPNPMTEAMAQFLDRHGIQTASRSAWTDMPFVVDGFLTSVPTIAVDAGYRELNGTQLVGGRWLTEADADLLAPAVVVNEPLLAMLGHSEWTGPFTATVDGSDSQLLVTVVGVTPDLWDWGEPEAFMLFDSYLARVATADDRSLLAPDMTIWVGPDQVDELTMRVQDELSVVGGRQYAVEVHRQDAFGDDAFMATFQLVVSGIGVLILSLSALNLVNIAIVTLRQRVREIGVRRALGASASRVFTAVMLESVVATALAGLVGVIGSILLVRNLPMDWLIGGIPGVLTPAFPLSAAIFGLVAATVVGALSGLIPAVMAVRIRPINAIRY